MNKQYKHIFWDLDHTLWDFETNSKNTLKSVYEQLNIAKFGIEDFENFSSIYEAHNESLWKKLRAGTISRTLLRWKRMDLTLQDFRIKNEVLAKAMSEEYLKLLPQQNVLMPEAESILQYCQDNGYIAHIITNGFQTTQLQKLNNSGIKQYFLNMFTSEQVNAMKPHPPIFLHALKVAEANLNESLMIGDCLEADMQGAKNVGMDRVFFNPKQNQHNDKVTHEIACLSELKLIL